MYNKTRKIWPRGLKYKRKYSSWIFTYSTGEPTFEPSLCNAREEVRNQRIKYTKQLIDLAVIVNAKTSVLQVESVFQETRQIKQLIILSIH